MHTKTKTSKNPAEFCSNDGIQVRTTPQMHSPFLPLGGGNGIRQNGYKHAPQMSLQHCLCSGRHSTVVEMAPVIKFSQKASEESKP